MKIDLLDNTPAEDVRIEIIPLVDVIFCILTFFILAAVGLTRQQAIDLDLPTANTGSPLPGIGADAIRRGRLYVSVDAIGQVYLDQQPVTLDLLNDVLLQHQQVAPEGLIVLYASRDARYEDVIRVLDLLRAVGGDRVALATLPSAIGDPTNPFPGDDLL
ncbi:MAG: biopolymer transporter ExbD, partial [Leptolyngbya sp. RL_3_1]|nr:biopolymer transporter ExbD [Leptolyngbya sp. RL_3_1]